MLTEVDRLTKDAQHALRQERRKTKLVILMYSGERWRNIWPLVELSWWPTQPARWLSFQVKDPIYDCNWMSEGQTCRWFRPSDRGALQFVFLLLPTRWSRKMLNFVLFKQLGVCVLPDNMMDIQDIATVITSVAKKEGCSLPTQLASRYSCWWILWQSWHYDTYDCMNEEETEFGAFVKFMLQDCREVW